ncbi:Dna polymerase beta domain protein region [uncultured Desulfobacterium sp.]|uniref:Dna polymerase beta domain protein region n=1 Tax=uncultured Desulfobacterium sp. TaxID=201089 RepID=A0A445N2U0_9BACT|nr:Dna polymerase beta domain protein region [uncultured Desulfobacterium sp.]
MDIKPILEDCKKILKDHYGSQFHGLLLYGSMARGQEVESSDMDLLVILSKPFNYFVELRKIIELLYPVQLVSEHLISAKPVAEDEFESGEIHLYRTAKREGIAA